LPRSECWASWSAGFDIFAGEPARRRVEQLLHRAVATRYDKRDYTFRGTVDLASIRIWLRDPVP